jgi:hypothetical protein
MLTFYSRRTSGGFFAKSSLNISTLQKGLLADWHITLLQFVTIAGFSLVPLLVNLPYRVNIFLSWEGAYRLYLGQMPFRDFGMPLGFGYFAVPALFFKLFGPYLFSLVYAQAFLNLLTLLSLRSILRLLGVQPANVLLAILVMCLTFTFPINFWPWYNNSAYIYGMFGLNMLLLYMFGNDQRRNSLYLVAAGFFMAFSLFTKQDFGGLSFAFGFLLLSYHSFLSKDYKSLLWYSTAFAGFLTLFIVPFLPHDFLYWFNYGQEPHDSRLHINTFAGSILNGSLYEKFYLLLIGLVVFFRFRSLKLLFLDKREGTFFLVSAGMVCMALITQVTSRLPEDTSTYFHAFAFAYILEGLSKKQQTSHLKYLGMLGFLTFFWWSGVVWKYTSKFFSVQDQSVATASQEAGIEWGLSDFRVFKNVYLPKETIAGMERIKKLPVVQKNKAGLQVLNMSELTPLAHELGYEPMINQPLWYHLNIGMFDKQVQEFNARIEQKQYDLVLFEDIPSLTEFYPYEVQEALQENYELKDRFLAPRALGDSYIEVYTRKTNE